ncbi:hypothetical protein F5Y08DRAFT_319719 [Xylaria arbuscula]|nr:hypothetical protein F5Y08DRAFT_319719 [Xylaria arbuscula]
MAYKASSRCLIALLAALSYYSGVAHAQDLCPALDDIGHAIESQTWALSGLNWTLTQITGGTWPTADWDFDEARVTFAVESEFDGVGTVQCTAQGKEFSEEYLRQLGGRGEDPVYGWYECEGGDSAVVKTEFKMVWWNTHTVNIRQTWTCPETGNPIRATGEVGLSRLDCEFDDESRRTHCAFQADYTPAIDTTIVEVLPAPTRQCTAASEAAPDWTVLDLVWVHGTTIYPVAILQHANMTFRLVNEALDYSPRMNCTEPELHGPQGGVYITPYTCTVFEANEEDVPATRFDWVVDDTNLLRINQTWYCDDGADGETRYQSIGELDVTSLLSCQTTQNNYTVNGVPVSETYTTCIADSDFEIKGGLQ